MKFICPKIHHKTMKKIMAKPNAKSLIPVFYACTHKMTVGIHRKNFLKNKQGVLLRGEKFMGKQSASSRKRAWGVSPRASISPSRSFLAGMT